MALDRSVLRDRIKDLIIERILDGTYQPGARIVESQLAQELGTSQAPVREALRDLDAMRFIESVPYKGARVRLVTDRDLAETYPVRAALEELAGQMAAARVTDQVLNDLEHELAEMHRYARSGDLHAQLSHDARFHEIIVEASGNAVLLETWRALRIEARTLISVIRSRTDVEEIANLHRVIIDALRSRDALLVGKELRQHIEMFGVALDD